MIILNLEEIQVKQLAYRGIWVLVMVLVGWGSNDNRLRVGEKLDWIICHSDCKHLHQSLLLPVIHQIFEPER